MEDDYGSGFKVGDYIAGAGFAADVAVVITADDVPHNGVVSFMKDPCLVGANLSVRGTEEV